MTDPLRMLVFAAAVLGAFGAGTLSSQAEDAGFIAGTTPDRRPEGAPVISKANHDRAWYAHGLTGVVPPYPPSLNFLDQQGDWYTPFTRQGMPGAYDIRGWYGGKS